MDIGKTQTTGFYALRFVFSIKAQNRQKEAILKSMYYLYSNKHLHRIHNSLTKLAKSIKIRIKTKTGTGLPKSIEPNEMKKIKTETKCQCN